MKRKYTRTVSSDKLQLLSNGVKPLSRGNLPPEILKAIELTAKHRKALNLFDDTEDRIERALRYQEFRK